MGRILERFRAWRRKRSEPISDADASSQDWKTVGKTFRATDAVVHHNLPMTPKDEGRPPH